MRRASFRLVWLATGLVVGGLLLSGCFQQAGEPLQPTQPGAAQPQPTPTDVVQTQPTPQPVATTPVIAPTQEVLTTPFQVASPAFVQPTQTPQLVVPTLIPTSEELLGQGGQQLSVADMTATAASLAQAEGEAIPAVELALTATAMFQPLQPQATETPTVPAVAQLPTNTPTLTATFAGPVDPLAQQATEMVRGATEAAARNLTAIATASMTFVPTATPTPTATRELGQDCIHTVVRGETAYRIARRYGVTLDQIAQANGLTNLSLLSVGQQLVIPGCGTTGVTPPPTATPRATGTPGEAVPLPEAETYVVQPGDNLYRISLRFGVSMRALANANGITNINYIRAGDTLVIPGR